MSFLDTLLGRKRQDPIAPAGLSTNYVAPQARSNPFNFQPVPSRVVLGASTSSRVIPTGISPSYGTGMAGGAGPSGGAPAPAPTFAGPNPEDLANGGAAARLGIIQQRLDALRGSVGQQKNEANSYLSEMLGNIGSTYGNLIQQGKDKLGTVLSNLGQERVGVENQYGRAAGQARRAVDNAITRNRMLARALNRLDSSFYEDKLAGIEEEGRGTQADIATEESSKLTGIGTRETEAKNDFERQDIALKQEQATLENQARREARQRILELEDIERNSGFDASEDKLAVVDDLYSRLDGIRSRAEQQRFNILGMIAQGGQTAGDFIRNYQALSPALSGILGVNTGLARAGQVGSAVGDIGFASPQAGNSYLANINRNLSEEEKQRLRLMGIQI